ncbi:MAG: hypothetical protein E6Q77_11295 [Rhizobium sp.]|nr:MAG: hypothetical protein E6Q77_11295 [Rhizobium sp.]
MRDVSIIGSCVTRDSFEFDAHQRPQIKFYAARTSFASSFASSVFPLDLADLDPSNAIKSGWQRKMIEQDLKKTLAHQVMSLAPNDVIILDFIDERFDLVFFKNCIATYSAELRKDTGFANYLSGSSLLKSGSDEHKMYWRDGFLKFLSIANTLSLKIIINNCLWASYNDSGTRTMDESIVINNNNLLRYFYKFARDNCNGKMIFHNEDEFEFIASTTHRWSPAPFHYTNDTYLFFNKRVDEYVR